ncbi:MAG: hypothetical protein V2I43_09980 [Parvularcula sp.]|jgi:hypothetical protein|nr:hypothetical protein [Parvularcula sp.]
MEIEELLRKYGQPRSMVVRPDDQSGWMLPFEMQAQNLCGIVGADFVFLESPDMQAVAIQDGRSVVGVYAGMFWMLCRLASLVAGTGTFPAMKGDAEPEWKPDLGRSLKTPRELLQETAPFDWRLESIGWKQAEERQILFYAVLSLSFRFVVLHELGHIVNDHQPRRKLHGPGALLVDRPSPPLLDPEEGVRSQAREIIADGFACLHTIDTFNNELTNGSHLVMAQIIRERLAPDTSALIRFVMSVLFLYFRLSDRLDWQRLPIERLSHPPAPFRMKALFAMLHEAKPLGIDEKTATTIISETVVSSDALMSVVLNTFPQPDWIKQISTHAHDRHFERIYEQCPNWSGRLPTA